MDTPTVSVDYFFRFSSTSPPTKFTTQPRIINGALR
ncbi:hypothetical protein CPAR01_16775 [Colletotrichum paranaense]|uniref:Uncharacterized protein n=1 Tax=Colletotrichum paranaense TaxID=1914294 RepID=A0ABQ9RV39_9PEZI|nr:uncharacterized protein CPAR01_16775 [Colletotrichum paranaense]KAK1515356.1 hypothetical protein CPAR01_16775 [Colletotrichum paranaense]